jgi:hypothetical protein
MIELLFCSVSRGGNAAVRAFTVSVIPPVLRSAGGTSLMTLGTFRRWMVGAPLILTAGTVLFFLVAPAAGYPLEFDQGWSMARISIPLFTFYLGSAISFAVGRSTDDGKPSPPLFSGLVFGTIALYVIVAGILLLVFGVTNGQNAPLGMTCSRIMRIRLVPDEGLEPPTFGLQNRCSTN